MATAQRKKSEYNLRDYESLPTVRKKTKKRLPKVIIRPGSSKRRSYDSIVNSGALEREPFVPKPLVDREAEKRRLQDHMVYGEEGPPKPVVKKTAAKPQKFKPLNRFDQCEYSLLEHLFLLLLLLLCMFSNNDNPFSLSFSLISDFFYFDS